MSTPHQEVTPEIVKAIPLTFKEQLKTHESQLILTQKRFDKIKADLLKAIDAMNQNHSMFSRAAKYWSEVHLWKKIVFGVAVTVPFFVIGVLAEIGVFLTLSIYTAFVYATSSILLDNHESETKNNTDNLRAGVTGLADLLGEVIQSLGILREQLTAEIDRLQAENEKLATNVTKLSDEIKQLQETGKDLAANVTKQKELLKKAEETQLQLSTDLQQIKTLNEVLKTHNQEWLSRLSITNKDLVEAYNTKLNDALKDGSKGLEQLTTRVSETQSKLADTIKELETNLKQQDDAFKEKVDEHKALLVEHRLIMEQCRELVKSLLQHNANQPAPQPPIQYAALIKRLGINDSRNQPAPDSAPRNEEPPAGISLH